MRGNLSPRAARKLANQQVFAAMREAEHAAQREAKEARKAQRAAEALAKKAEREAAKAAAKEEAARAAAEAEAAAKEAVVAEAAKPPPPPIAPQAREPPPPAPSAPSPRDTMTIDERIAYYKLGLENKFAYWRPYPKQLEFITMTADKREAMLRAANQYGKTTVGAYIAAAHATGRYPDWWTGRRFDHPTLGWVGGLSGVAVRDAAQTKLLGTPGDPSALGTAMVPKDLIVGNPNASRSAPNGVDSFLVRHVNGGNSRVVFKTYEQGAGFWQGPTVDWEWMDEEPPADVYGEALARLTGEGHIFVTLSPLLGRSLFLLRFLGELTPEQQRDRGNVRATLAEAEHFTEEQKQRRSASFSEYERSAREFGEPTLGEGAIFTTPEQDLRVRLSLDRVPMAWPKIWGLDFGSNHPFAAVLFAFDRDGDCDYILRCIKMTTPVNTPAILGHCDAIKRVAAQVPVAWPHDGAVAREGEALKDIYKHHGLLMLPEHATHAGTGGHWTQPGIDALQERMQQRKLLVLDAPENEKWFEEYRNYHYDKQNKPVWQFDDLMSATRIGYIMRRKARAVPLGGPGPKREAPRPYRGFDLFTGLPFEAGA